MDTPSNHTSHTSSPSPPRSSRSRRHEIPTHLNVEDRAFFGLSVRQVLYLVTGLAGAYGIWQQWSLLPGGARLAAATAVLLLAAAFALVRPQRRGLEEWVFVAAHYASVPKASTWRREPLGLAVHDEATAGGWATLAPVRRHTGTPAADASAGAPSAQGETPRC